MHHEGLEVVVPGYYLVWYNIFWSMNSSVSVVVPGYYLVWYNIKILKVESQSVVVPGYYLVWYNQVTRHKLITHSRSSRLLLGMV